MAPKRPTRYTQQDQESAPVSSKIHPQYLSGELSNILSNDAPTVPQNYVEITALSNSRNQEILTVTGATSPPPAILLDAYIDAYFQHVFHRFPVVDRADFSSSNPSAVLQQAICMMGTMLRYPKRPGILAENEIFYYNAKTLIHTNYEQDPITVLKVMCLLSTRNIAGPVMLTIDSGWHWLGIAIRLLQEMGLHREEICVGFVNSGVVRRIAWCLFVSALLNLIFLLFTASRFKINFSQLDLDGQLVSTKMSLMFGPWWREILSLQAFNLCFLLN